MEKKRDELLVEIEDWNDHFNNGGVFEAPHTGTEPEHVAEGVPAGRGSGC